MKKYIGRRLLLAVPTVFGVTVIIFLVMRVIPGDPVAIVFGMEGFQNLTDATRNRYIEDLGLADPYAVQYANWMRDVASGSLGESMLRGDAVSEIVIRRGPVTAEIGVLGIVVALLVGLPIGIISAVKPDSWLDFGARTFSIFFLAMPGFWLGTMIIVTSITWLNYHPPILPMQIWQDPWQNLQMVVGPGIIIGLGMSAFIARLSRSALFEVLRDDYVRTARAKGLAERVVIARHAFRNSLLPVVTLSGVLLAAAVGGSVAIEQAFSVPGLGVTLLRAAVERDIPVVQNIVLLYVLIFVIVNLAIDLSYAWLDPRIRYA